MSPCSRRSSRKVFSLWSAGNAFSKSRTAVNRADSQRAARLLMKEVGQVNDLCWQSAAPRLTWNGPSLALVLLAARFLIRLGFGTSGEPCPAHLARNQRAPFAKKTRVEALVQRCRCRESSSPPPGKPGSMRRPRTVSPEVKTGVSAESTKAGIRLVPQPIKMAQEQNTKKTPVSRIDQMMLRGRLVPRRQAMTS